MRIEAVAGGGIAERGAAHIAAVLRSSVAARGRVTVAFSGGSTAGPLLQALADADVPWSAVHVLQVDERVAPEGHPDRNLTTLRRRFIDCVPLPPDQLHAMPVDASDLDAAADRYAGTLQDLAGRPPRLDFIHLGLGTDGHTASLLPGSPLLSTGAPVGVTAAYRGRRRMTLTLPVLSDARHVLWFVRGADKAAMVRRLVDGDPTIPAGKVEPSRALLLLDPPAATALPSQVSGEAP
ncbi:MAG TPA: 6-phosphogluconolactonase [Longimicrobiales bacterium]|nr:6-phosphogluconolactonase [Longimicrobiales bacterium]